MTEEQLDALRKCAAIVHDEGSRLVRALKGSSASEANVREHLQNCLEACRKADAVLNPLPEVVFSVGHPSELEVPSAIDAVGPLDAGPTPLPITSSAQPVVQVSRRGRRR